MPSFAVDQNLMLSQNKLRRCHKRLDEHGPMDLDSGASLGPKTMSGKRKLARENSDPKAWRQITGACGVLTSRGPSSHLVERRLEEVENQRRQEKKRQDAARQKAELYPRGSAAAYNCALPLKCDTKLHDQEEPQGEPQGEPLSGEELAESDPENRLEPAVQHEFSDQEDKDCSSSNESGSLANAKLLANWHALFDEHLQDWHHMLDKLRPVGGITISPAGEAVLPIPNPANLKPLQSVGTPDATALHPPRTVGNLPQPEGFEISGEVAGTRTLPPLPPPEDPQASLQESSHHASPAWTKMTKTHSDPGMRLPKESTAGAMPNPNLKRKQSVMFNTVQTISERTEGGDGVHSIESLDAYEAKAQPACEDQKLKLKSHSESDSKLTRQSSRLSSVRVSENPSGDSNRLQVASREQLLDLFLGKQPVGESPPMSRCGSNDEREVADEFFWQLVLTLPGNTKGGDAKPISEEDALEIFEKCFKGEEAFEEYATAIDDTSLKQSLTEKGYATTGKVVAYHPGQNVEVQWSTDEASVETVPRDQVKIDGTPVQEKRFEEERDVFLKAFRTLPEFQPEISDVQKLLGDASTAVTQARKSMQGSFSGNNGPWKSNAKHSKKENQHPDRLLKGGGTDLDACQKSDTPGEETPENFLDLMRNVILTKLALHCRLTIRCRHSADHDKSDIFVMITSCSKDLFCEADRTGLNAELNVRVLDPQSLEPCTRTFYPLLHWFFKKELNPVGKGDSLDEELVSAYFDALDRCKEECSKKHHNIEREFWQSVEESAKAAGNVSRDSSNSAGSTIDLTQLSKMDKQTSIEKVKSRFTVLEALSSLTQIYTSGEQSGNAKLRSQHIGSWHSERVLKKKFLEYLKLKAEPGGFRRNPDKVMDEASKKVNMRTDTYSIEHKELGNGMVSWLNPFSSTSNLQNLYDVLKLETISPYIPFEIGLYDKKKWVYSEHVAAPRKGDKVIKIPFDGQQRLKLAKLIIDRQMDIHQLIINGLAISFFPLDTRAKVRNITEDFTYGSRSESIVGFKKEESTNKVLEKSPLAEAWSVPATGGFFAKAIAFLKTVPKPPSIHDIREYYGERISFYFALVLTLQRSLLKPGIVGIVTFILQLSEWDTQEAEKSNIRVMSLGFYTLVISGWATYILQIWKRKQKVLACCWGQHGVERHSSLRPAFRGIRRRSPVDYSDSDQFFPNGFWSFGTIGRLPYQIVSFTVLSLIAIVEIMVTMWVASWRSVLPFAADAITGGVTALQMSIFGMIGKRLSLELNRWENYSTNDDFLNMLIVKVFLFEFVNKFMTFFYIGFFKAGYEGCLVYDPGEGETVLRSPDEMGGNMCADELTSQARVVLLMEMARNSVELVQPLLLPRLRKVMRKTQFASARARAKSVLRKQTSLQEGKQSMSHFITYDLGKKDTYGTIEVDGTFWDYLEIMILFGFISLFSIMFPLIPIIGSGLLLFEYRVDGFKLFELVKRPLPSNAESIGNWMAVLQFLNLMSIITNAALMVWTLALFDGLVGENGRSFAFLCLLVLFMALKGVMYLIVPDVPKEINVLEDHQNWIRGEYVNEGGQIKIDRRPVHVTDVVIKPDEATSGQKRNPSEFGILQ